MPETPKPREPESPAPSQGRRDEPVVWPRDMNAPGTKNPVWGSDPEALRDA